MAAEQMMTQEGYAKWRNMRFTKEWFEYLRKEMQAEVDEPRYNPMSIDATALETARITGFVQGVRLALDPPDIFEEDNE